MKAIYKTKETVPLIFDYYPDTYVVDLYDELSWLEVGKTFKSHWHNQAELNSYFIDFDQTVFNVFSLRNGRLVMGKGIISFENLRGIIYKENGELKGAIAYNRHISSSSRTIVNKFFKSYGIKLKDVIALSPKDFANKFLFPVRFGINDLHPNVQKTISSEFLKQEREKISVSTEEAVEVL